MPIALAFIGGGLLQGVGKGLTEQGKDKRKRALADLEHTRNLQRDAANQRARRGLLDERLRVEQLRDKEREAAAGGRLDKTLKNQQTLFDKGSTERKALQADRIESAELIALENRLLKEGISEAEIAFRQTEGFLTRKASAAQLKARLESNETLNQRNIDAAQARLDAGFGHSKTLKQADIDAAQERLDKKLGSAADLQGQQLESADRRAAAQRNLTASEGALDRAKPVSQSPGSQLTDPKTGKAIGPSVPALPKDTSVAEERAWDIEVAAAAEVNEFGEPSGAVDMNRVSEGMKRRGFPESAATALAAAQKVETDDRNKKRDEYAENRANETASILLPAFVDFRQFDGSRSKAIEFYKLEYDALQKGESLPTPPGPSQDAPTTRPATGGPGGARGPGRQAPQGGDRTPYTGTTAPPNRPQAVQKDGFWYVKTGPGPKDWSRVMVAP